MMTQPQFRVAVYGLPPELLRIIEVVFRHIRHNRFRFDLGDPTAPGGVDLLIVGALPGLTQGLLARGVPAHPLACTVYVSDEPTPAPSYSIAPARLLPDLLPLLNRVALEQLAAQVDGAKSQAPEVRSPGAAPARVLLVKPDDQARLELWSQLEALGFVVSAADTAAAAQPRLESDAVDLLLVDRWLADADGADFALAARRLPALAGHPIWVLGGQVRWRDVMRCAWRGLDGYLALPAGPHELRRVLGRYVGRRPSALGAASLVSAASCR